MDMMFEAYLTHEANSKSEDIPVTAEPVWILGKKYSSIHNLDEIRKDIHSRLWFTYRKGFIQIGDTGLTSDKGWGCMLRCGQMVLAQALIHLHLGREWRWPPLERSSRDESYRTYLRILRMFEDRRAAPFSIHQIALMGASSEGKAVGEWFGPNTVAQVLRKLAVYDEWSSLVVHVAMDNTVIIDNIKRQCFTAPGCTDGMVRSKDTSPWRPLLLVIPLRLGLSDINPLYIQGLKVCFTFKQSLGVIGGKPNHALYFIGCVGDEVIFLDPHTTQPTACLPEDEKGFVTSDQVNGSADNSYHCPFASRIHILGMDPSVAVCFLCPSEKDFDSLCSQIQQQIVLPERQPLFELCFNRSSDWSRSDESCSSSASACTPLDDPAKHPVRAAASMLEEAACIALEDFDRQFDDSDEDFELLG